VLGPAALAIQDRIRAPVAIGAQSVLATATLAVQAHANIVLPIGRGMAKPISEFFITVAMTGERKTACDDQAAWPINRQERKLRESYDSELSDYHDAKLAWERTREAVARDKKRDYGAKKAALRDIGPAPLPPLQSLLICDEPTLEGVWRLSRDGQPSLGVFTTEGGRFLGGHAMNDDNRLKTAAGLSSIWDGQPWRRVRASEDASILAGRRLAAHLMLQPAVADILFNDPLLTDQGLLSRLLATAPESSVGTRFHREEKPQTDSEIKRYGAIVLGILETPPPLVAGSRQELDPRPLPLSPRARTLWVQFLDHIELQLKPGGESRLDPRAGKQVAGARRSPRRGTDLGRQSRCRRNRACRDAGRHRTRRALQRRGAAAVRLEPGHCRAARGDAAARLVVEWMGRTGDFAPRHLSARPARNPRQRHGQEAGCDPRGPRLAKAHPRRRNCSRATAP